MVNQDGNLSREGGRKSKRVIGNLKTMIWQKSNDQPQTVRKQSACTDNDKVKINDMPKRKYRVQDLVGDDRVLAPGKNFHPKKGNRAKYIADRLQSLIGLTPDESIKLRYTEGKQNQKNYSRYEDCKYDLNHEYLKLVNHSSKEGRACVHMAEWLTPKPGTLTSAVDRKMHLSYRFGDKRERCRQTQATN